MSAADDEPVGGTQSALPFAIAIAAGLVGLYFITKKEPPRFDIEADAEALHGSASTTGPAEVPTTLEQTPAAVPVQVPAEASAPTASPQATATRTGTAASSAGQTKQAATIPLDTDSPAAATTVAIPAHNTRDTRQRAMSARARAAEITAALEAGKKDPQSWVRRYTVPDEEAIAAACDLESSTSHPCGDADQSPLRPGYHGETLYQMWARGGDLNPWARPQDYGAFFVACAHGQVDEVQTSILRAAADLQCLLERRESNLRYSPLHVTVAGSRMRDLEPYKVKAAASPNYVGVARALLTAGARTEAKDILGHTPIALATNSLATPTSLRIARVLAGHGASMIATTRMGMPLLYNAAISQRANLDSIRLLLELGADPKQPLYGGVDLTWCLKKQPASTGKDGVIALLAAHAAKTSAHPLVGLTVALHGLKSSSELNGCQGRAVSWHANAERIQVKLFSRSHTLALKPANLSAMPAESQQFVPGTAVTISGLASRPELNGRIGLVDGFAEGRYAVEVKHQAAPADWIRLKPDSLTVATTVDAVCLLDKLTLVEGLDLRRLKPWPGLNCGATVLSRTETDATGAREKDIEPQPALKTCFVLAVPHTTRSALKGTLNEEFGGMDVSDSAEQDETAAAANLAPFAQWAYSLFHVIHLYEEPEHFHHPPTFRFLIGKEEEAECIIIDVLSGPLACPQHLEVNRTKWGAIAQQEEGQAMCEPLLPIRYWYVPKGEERKQRDRVACAAEHCPVTKRAFEAKHLDPAKHAGPPSTILVRTSSSHEIGAALANLQENEQLLSTEFRDHFYNASAAHSETDGKGFRCSFLAPPLPPKRGRQREYLLCAGCNRTREQLECNSFKECGKCGTHAYCSNECAKKHWKKAHKRECQISLEAVRDHDSPTARPSVVFSTCPPPMLLGQCQVSFSHVTGAILLNGVASSKLNPDNKEHYKPCEDKPARNVHGSRSFTVKVQPLASLATPGLGPHGFAAEGEHKSRPWGCVVYDEMRTFEAYLPMDAPGIDPLLGLIRKEGISVNIGGPTVPMKAYCEAVRVGPHLRIYTDKLETRQPW